ncbi:SusD/RagB family nutrient-binding outer membrane lipoprotein [Flavobacterium luteum]|uniref:SusD/RagB family nutrient-binding outer membrane lipoprotein n=1 Tax=Flavobacterium luteum TaxID=2026654 RepID=A0A7J5ADS8_9FLAO|nr:SusD/RagB family nutrient-binding outer membrane lipoprotein [Flavobacterium luteum]KAB1155737.1 SusD/RagB family nutrient-binding outer membrane lipoprotein [Flavobacterium luteum]
MKKNKLYIKLILVLSLFIGSSCETLELDKSKDPFSLTPDQADVEFLFNGLQEDFARQIEGDGDYSTGDNWQSGGATAGDGLSLFGGQLTRMYGLTNSGAATYNSAFNASDSDDEWLNVYSGILLNIRAMTPLAEAQDKTHHIGIAQFIEAYTMTAMVDFYGDIPYTEALLGADNLNPAADSGASVYAACIALLDKAILNFKSTAKSEPSDLFYNNDYEKWIKAANTLKMRLYLQTRLVDSDAINKFNTIVNSGDYINDSADDLVYNWFGTNTSNPDNRHPRYGLNYTTTGAADYLSNWFMGTMNNLKDPRIRYYYYRQESAVPGQEIDPNEAILPCSLNSAPAHYIAGGFTFCGLKNGYWGRDHGDVSGSPADGFKKTTFGVYPAGGKFDADQFTDITPTSGGKGKGITPILLASWVDFMKAEVALVQNNPALAKTEMINGMNKSISKVISFGQLDPDYSDAKDAFEPSSSAITDYIDFISNSWETADNAGKWNIFAVQYFFNVYGNGIESYNFYRRTGYPTSLQPMLQPTPGGFMRSLYYPSNSANNNSSITQKPNQTVPVFWNTNSSPIAN